MSFSSGWEIYAISPQEPGVESVPAPSGAAPMGPTEGGTGLVRLPVLVDTTYGSVENLVVVVSRPLHVTLRSTSRGLGHDL